MNNGVWTGRLESWNVLGLVLVLLPYITVFTVFYPEMASLPPRTCLDFRNGT